MIVRLAFAKHPDLDEPPIAVAVVDEETEREWCGRPLGYAHAVTRYRDEGFEVREVVVDVDPEPFGRRLRLVEVTT